MSFFFKSYFIVNKQIDASSRPLNDAAYSCVSYAFILGYRYWIFYHLFFYCILTAFKLSKEAKKKADELVKDVKSIFLERLKTVKWMSAPTRKKALKKFSMLNVKIGYPEKFRDYSSLQIERDDVYLVKKFWLTHNHE